MIRNHFVKIDNCVIVETERKGIKYDVIMEYEDFKRLIDYGVTSICLRKSVNNLYPIATAWGNGGQFYVHRFITEADDHERVYFLNGDTLDLRKNNLRVKAIGKAS